MKSNTILCISQSEIKWCNWIRFYNSSTVELKNSSFENLKYGIYGYLKENNTPIFDNIVSRNLIYGLCSYDDTDWEVTGTHTNITGNRYDVTIGSSGNIYISSSCYETIGIGKGATGKVLEPE